MTEERPERDGVAIDLPGEAAGGTPRGTRVILLFARLLFMALILATPALVIASRPINPTDPDPFRFSIVLGLTLAVGAIGLIVVVIDAMTPNKRLASIFGVYLGICLGLVGTFAIGTLLDTIIQAWELDRTNAVLYVNLAKVSVGLILCYIAVSVVMTTKDDFRLVIPYVEFSKQNRGVRPMLLDTSAIIDGRILDLSESGALDAPFVVLQPVIDELQKLSDSSDKGKRARGRRGLDMIAKLQASPRVAISIEEAQIDGGNVDRGLVDVAKLRGYRVVTTDAGLAKIAEIAAVTSININRIAGTLRAQALAGDRLEIELVREGENPTQGVGYLSDGTMVVVEGGAGRMGETVSTVVTNTLTTSAGRMIFARVEDLPPESGSAASMATRATTQPKHRDGSRESHRDGGQPRDEDGRPGSGRNPRRG
jgi:uncharacterized protein YacL